MRRLITLFVLWLTILSAIPGIASLPQTRTAQAQETQFVYLPWVPHVGTTNGVGPWYGRISMQNLSDFPCSVSIWVGGPGGWTRNAQLSLRGGASRTMSSTSLAVPRPGAPIRLESFCPLVASVKEVMPDSRFTAWSDGAQVVTGYAAIAEVDLDAASETTSSGWFLPIVQTNSDWNTIIRIANFQEAGTVTAQIQLYPNGNQLGGAGAEKTLSVSIPAGGHVGIDLLAEIGEHGWVGYASVTANGPVGVLAHRSKPSTSMALTNLAVAADREAESGPQLLSAPLLFSAYNGWNTGINLANVSDGPAEVTVSYYETGGSFLREESFTLQARSMEYLYTPGNVDQEGFVGSATISSTAPVVGAIDEVKYETTEAMSYMASLVGQMSAAIPLVLKEDPQTGRHDNSGINVANLNQSAPQDIEIVLFTDTGDPLLDSPIILTLPPGGSNFLYLPFIEEVPAGTVASARLRSADPQGFVAVSNNVNYAVAGDGSVVFSATSERGYYRLNGGNGQ
jgi:hypothetical protein